jgi:hypothetical protein
MIAERRNPSPQPIHYLRRAVGINGGIPECRVRLRPLTQVKRPDHYPVPHSHDGAFPPVARPPSADSVRPERYCPALSPCLGATQAARRASGPRGHGNAGVSDPALGPTTIDTGHLLQEHDRAGQGERRVWSQWLRHSLGHRAGGRARRMAPAALKSVRPRPNPPRRAAMGSSSQSPWAHLIAPQ